MTTPPVHTIERSAIPTMATGGWSWRRTGWRLVYRILDSQLFVALTAVSLAIVAKAFGENRAQGLLSAFERGFVVSGWPHHGYAWVNLHVSRFTFRIRRFWDRPASVSPRSVALRTPLRFGCVGRFRGLLSFPKVLFAQFPPDVELHLIDLEYDGACADYLAGVTPHYVPVRSTDNEVECAADAINAADLDVLLNANSRLDAYRLLDRIDTPCILNFCPGSDLLYHDRVAVHMNGQPQADYFFADRRVFCGTTGEFFSQQRIYPVRGYYDPRDMLTERRKTWVERKPLMVFHGSLYKLAHDDVLKTLLSVVADDSSVSFVIMGRDSRDALARIAAAARRYGVSDRVHYEGAFLHTRAQTGGIPDPGWQRLLSYLAEARLAPNPWPVGGASSRFEAFTMGVPTVHIGVRTDPASWGRPQPSVVEVPHMLVPDAVAWTVEAYRALCERCLRDESFASAIAAAQQRIARRLGDPERLWHQVFDCYREWLQTVGSSATHVESVMHGIESRMVPDTAVTFGARQE